ncbi:MAG: ThuA domain-containing protein [Clostridia bacterium]|nr:ThuA domain-containing protein [Clostridia bacterium]
MKEKILVLCDDAWHPAEIIELGLAARQDERFEFEVIKAVKDILTPAKLAQYRMVICCKSNNVTAANNAPWFEPGVTEVCPKEFEEYIRVGGGFLAVHSGLAYTRERNSEYVDLAGSIFHGHPPRCTVNLHVTKPEHPVVEGIGDFTVRDEHYNMEMVCTDADIFMESTSEKGGTQPTGYTREMGKGRFCALTPGHTMDVWENKQFQKLFTNAMEWCLQER